jgi:hypothetical protein
MNPQQVTLPLEIVNALIGIANQSHLPTFQVNPVIQAAQQQARLVEPEKPAAPAPAATMPVQG